MSDLRKEIEAAVNRCSAENGSNTPDWVLAEYLLGALRAFDFAVLAREKWYGRARKCTCGPNAACAMPCDRDNPALMLPVPPNESS